VGGYVGASQVSPVSSAQAEDESAGSLSLSKLVIGLIGASLSYALALAKDGKLWLLLWAVGAVGTMVWYIVGYLRFSRALKRTLKSADIFEKHLFNWLGGSKRLKLYRSPAVSTPMLTGLLHPMLVIPDRIYSENMLRDILRHELTHYKRKDLIVKWFAVFVTAVHWFNPVVHLVRHELDRECEMSCDERLLRTMDRDAKQHYGETLLSMAANNSLPRRLVATTFATEKRNLKERLEQIMTYKHMGRTTLALLLVAAMLLVGCGTAVGPDNSNSNANEVSNEAAVTDDTAPQADTVVPTPAATSYANNVTVSTVDELLAAIGPDTSIILTAGTYDLSKASNYGKDSGSDYYSWVECYDGYQLVLNGLDKFMLFGDPGGVTISATPRYANVLSFEQSSNLILTGLTIGHTEAPGECVGGVVSLDNVNTATISQCSMFGCGTVGVEATLSDNIKVLDSEIYDCSYYAVNIVSSSTVLFDGCTFHDNETYVNLFQFANSANVAVINSEVYNNVSHCNMIYSGNSQDVIFAGNKVHDNSADSGLLFFSGYAITIDKCSFENNSGEWYGQSTFSTEPESIKAVNADNKELSKSDFLAMEWSSYDSWAPVEYSTPEVSQSDDGYIHVSTVDEFLAAIGSDTKIYLEDGVFDLTTASNYGSVGGANYSWVDTYVDGPQLVISGVKNLTITGSDVSRALIQAVPRYAEVLKFENCENISLANFTAGHSEGSSKCVGGVLFFNGCSEISVDNLSLYGCGVWGITTYQSENMTVTGTEIYDCSNGDLDLLHSNNLTFENCNFHDNGPDRTVFECNNVTLDGKELESRYDDVA
jgi:beta-lactamase regulating signal transducer with metallopeptidase domain